jgi:hypothetical protein
MTSIISDLLRDKFENLSGKAELPGSQGRMAWIQKLC